MSEQESEILVDEADGESETESLESSKDVSADVVNLSQAGAGTIKAEIVRISQGGAEQVIANEVEVKQGGVNRIQAENVKLSDGGAAFIQATSVDFRDGGVGAIRAQDLSFEDGGAGVICSENVEMRENAVAGVIVAQQVVGDSIQTKLLLAGSVEGNVETVLDTNQALFAGMAAGAVIGLFLFVGQLFSRRR
jgi:hypothetical protein